jgi:hypothetical protein
MPGEDLSTASYTRSLNKTTARLEALLKVIVTPVDPPEGFILNYTLLIGDESVNNFQKVRYSSCVLRINDELDVDFGPEGYTKSCAEQVIGVLSKHHQHEDRPRKHILSFLARYGPSGDRAWWRESHQSWCE